MRADRCDDRQILAVGGEDRMEFLQGLVTNDLALLADGLVYAALLTPQGKYLADFFLLRTEDAILIDVKADLAAGLMQRLSMYKLRSKVTLEERDLPVWRGLGDGPEGAFADPRDPSLGWRYYGELDAEPAGVDWDALRVAACVPESGVELIPDGSFILESGFERLNGVDFKKGCYVGQEVTARMKHKTELRKGLAKVTVDGAAPVGSAITAGEKTAGTLYTQAGGAGIAYLRFDRATGEMQADGVPVTLAS
ncbi:folate-binding protein [Psychromarinibacter sp. C21-152]|uniref:Folate-binding protein n=1 Tax=Psychromarinibacter sediminicola TaxID=3033385 RepID=A0AAE3T730_9RHOB|nr:folate-binding protein [Psychromarinibacter sediminicola]MDF0599930.1 folate-binding protein [Psychromarinibacter sediminicola]